MTSEEHILVSITKDTVQVHGQGISLRLKHLPKCLEVPPDAIYLWNRFVYVHMGRVDDFADLLEQCVKKFVRFNALVRLEHPAEVASREFLVRVLLGEVVFVLREKHFA